MQSRDDVLQRPRCTERSSPGTHVVQSSSRARRSRGNQEKRFRCSSHDCQSNNPSAGDGQRKTDVRSMIGPRHLATVNWSQTSILSMSNPFGENSAVRISDLDVPVMLSFVTDVRSSSPLPLWEKVAIGGLRPPFFLSRTPMLCIGYAKVRDG